MCLYPRLILNPKYKATKKNGGNIPPITDERVKYVPIGCTKCIECTKQKSRAWQARLLEHIKHNTNGKFITLTFSNEEYADLFSDLEPHQQTHDYGMDNAIATLATRRFLERWRKKYTKSLQHWFVTELGHQGTENIHLHGIIWTNETLETVEKIWQYGHIWKGKQLMVKIGKQYHQKTINYVNETTIAYITKYITKIDQLHPSYTPKILTSPGIGNQYKNSCDSRHNAFKHGVGNTVETYKTRTGHKISLPIYWRNQIYTEQQREQLWLYRLDKNERWLCKERLDMNQPNATETYLKLLKWHQQRNRQLGYSDGSKNWSEKQYEDQRRRLLTARRRDKTFAKRADGGSATPVRRRKLKPTA